MNVSPIIKDVSPIIKGEWSIIRNVSPIIEQVSLVIRNVSPIIWDVSLINKDVSPIIRGVSTIILGVSLIVKDVSGNVWLVSRLIYAKFIRVQRFVLFQIPSENESEHTIWHLPMLFRLIACDCKRKKILSRNYKKNIFSFHSVKSLGKCWKLYKNQPYQFFKRPTLKNYVKAWVKQLNNWCAVNRNFFFIDLGANN